MLKFLSFLIMIAISKTFHLTPTRIFKGSSFIRAKFSMTSSPVQSTNLLTNSQNYNPEIGTQYIFVGGKGGVGKTSTASAIAIALSDIGLRTLIVSTDPAHSLGDALDVNLSSGKIEKIQSESNLYALEIDVEDALLSFKETAKGLTAEGLSKSFGVPQDILTSLGLDDLTSLFTNPPPGIDEIVALNKVFQYGDAKNEFGEPKFQRIIIDTAPTGHTVRLLQLPDFLNSITGKLIKFRTKVTKAIDSFKSLLGGNNPSAPIQENPLDKLETLQTSMIKMQKTLKNPKYTQFVIVCIPTSLAIAETKRLLTNLNYEKIKVSTIVCNQILDETLGPKYLTTRSSSQRNAINKLSNKAKYIQPNIEIIEVPYVDTEVMGLYGLKFFATMAHPVKAKTASNPMDSKKLTIFGGKGGVGKTTTSSSWAVQLCESGFRTLVVSTDPAHSLGDAFQESLSGIPKRLDIPSITMNGGQLWAMEIDPQSALEEFKEIVGEATSGATSSSDTGSSGFMGSIPGMADMKSDLIDMLSGVSDPPPGTDEVVALTKIINYLTNGYVLPNGNKIMFDRIVLDTAPTGHTLRMLQLPPFLLKVVEKLKTIKAKTSGGIFGAMTGMSDNSDTTTSTSQQSTENRLDKFEKNMIKLQTLLHNPKECEFSVVTIPTELATAESERLLEALKKESILCRRVIINQVLPTHTTSSDATTTTDSTVDVAAISNAYLNKLRQGQTKSLNELSLMVKTDIGPGSDEKEIPIIQVPYFDMEVRTVYGLRVISNFLFPHKNK